MTVGYVGNGILIGLSTDTKPTTYANGTRFIETDTGAVYQYMLSVWTLTSYGHILVKKRANWWGTVHAAADGGWTGAITAITVGTGATGGVNLAADGTKTRYTTGATINSLTGARISATLTIRRDLNPWTTWKLAPVTNVLTRRIFFGYTSSTSAPVSAADPLANLSGVGFFYDSAVDGNWHIMQNDGSASSDSTTIANVAAAAAAVHTFGLRANNASTRFEYSYDGGAWTTINTKIPAATTSLGWTWYQENLAASALFFDIYWITAIWDA